MRKAAYQAKQSILCYPHSKLTEVSSEIISNQIKTPMVRRAIHKLRESANLLNLHSICGPKLGFPYRMVLLRNKDSSLLDAYINPKVVDADLQNYGMWENCISLDAVLVWLLRSSKISVEAANEEGEKKLIHLSGLAARLLLHEMEHLNGECIMTRVKSRKYIVTSDALLQKNLWEPNFPSSEAFTTPLFSYYDFSLSRVVNVPELSSEADAFSRHSMMPQRLDN